MINEFDESVSIYIWPTDAEEGWTAPDDFWDRVRRGLASEGIDFESV